MDNLELRTEGRIISPSGKLLIIDPCYLEGFDFGPIEAVDNSYFERWHALEARELKLWERKLESIDNLIESMDEMREALEKGGSIRDAMQSIRGISPEEVAEREQIAKERELLKQNPGILKPPYIAQGEQYVALSNSIGDGRYPVVQTPLTFKIIFNYWIDEKGGYDTSRLPGRLVGSSGVDSGTQVLIDLEKARIQKDIRPELYTLLDLKGKPHRCRFVGNKGNYWDALSIYPTKT